MEVLIDDRDFNSDCDAPWRTRFGLRREGDESAADARNLGLGFGFASRISGRSEVDKAVSPSSSSSSSIGAQSDDEAEDDDEVQSQERSGLSSLHSLEYSLPIKGLSSHFTGKSKSFTNLSTVGSVDDLIKVENPINKRRRTLMASKWARQASFYGWSSMKMTCRLRRHGNQDLGTTIGEENQELQVAQLFLLDRFAGGRMNALLKLSSSTTTLNNQMNGVGTCLHLISF